MRQRDRPRTAPADRRGSSKAPSQGEEQGVISESGVSTLWHQTAI